MLQLFYIDIECEIRPNSSAPGDTAVIFNW